jgi:hypothetical protein
MIGEYRVSYFKFDGVGVGNFTPGDPQRSFSNENLADIEALLRLTGDLRQARPDVYLSITTGTWPSPFWLWHGDSTWRGGDDLGFCGQGSLRQQWITYRDAITQQMVVRRGPLYPLNALMNEGIAYAQLGTAARMANDPNDLRDEFRMFFASGTQLQELYMTPRMMTPALWDILAEAARWSRANDDVLVDTHWIGGDAGKGEVYGYAAWSPRKGIVSLRNPGSNAASFDLQLAAALGLPPGAPRQYTLKSPWKDEASRPAIAVSADQRRRFELRPFGVLILEAAPEK